MRGRKPVPTGIHQARGTFRPGRHGEKRAKEPAADGDLIEPPEWMTDSQQAGWRYAIDHAPAGVLKMIDRGILAIWVVAEDHHRQATLQQAIFDARPEWNFPMLARSKSGLIPSPYFAIVKQSAAVMMKAGSDLGFSPASRPRLAGGSAPAEQDEDNEEGTLDPWKRLKLLQGGKGGG